LLWSWTCACEFSLWQSGVVLPICASCAFADVAQRVSAVLPIRQAFVNVLIFETPKIFVFIHSGHRYSLLTYAFIRFVAYALSGNEAKRKFG